LFAIARSATADYYFHITCNVLVVLRDVGIHLTHCQRKTSA